MLKSAYEGLNARPKLYLSKEYFCEMYMTCVFSKLCDFIFQSDATQCFCAVVVGQPGWVVSRKSEKEAL